MTARRRRLRTEFRIAILIVLLASIRIAPAAAISGQQIEADWTRQSRLRAPEFPVSPEQDAAGACDGVKDGQWGFHTEHEDRPWWQIDLGGSCELDRLHVYNRTEFAQRAARLIVLISNDDKDFRQVYQHDGTAFFGHRDGKPLTIPLTWKNSPSKRTGPKSANARLGKAGCSPCSRMTRHTKTSASTKTTSNDW